MYSTNLHFEHLPFLAAVCEMSGVKTFCLVLLEMEKK